MEGQDFVEVLPEQRQRIMRAHTAQAGGLHGSLHLFHGEVEEPSCFHFLIAQGPDLLEGAA